MKIKLTRHQKQNNKKTTKKECKKILTDVFNEEAKYHNLESFTAVVFQDFDVVYSGEMINKYSGIAFLEAILELSKDITFIFANPRIPYRSLSGNLALKHLTFSGSSVSPFSVTSDEARYLLSAFIKIGIKLTIDEDGFAFYNDELSK